MGELKIIEDKIMKLINPKVEQWQCGYTLPDIWSHIARCARTCYQSEPRSNGETDEEFVKRVILRNHSFKEIAKSRELQLKLHLSVLEHGTVYLFLANKNYDRALIYRDSPYSMVYIDEFNNSYVTTNMRVIVENGRMCDLEYLCPPDAHFYLRTTFSIITDIGVARELDRHRSHSISEESTRFCNYSKDKFGNELTFIKPEWFNSLYIDKDGHWDNINYYSHDDRSQIEDFYAGDLLVAERNYIYLLKSGWTPQQARQVLPLSTKVQTIHTAFNDDWEEFIKLRADACSGSVHPNMKVIANMIKNELYGTNAE